VTLPIGLRRLLLGSALIGGAWAGLQRPEVQRADVRVGDAFRELSNPLLDRAVSGSTDLGSVYGVVGSAAVLALCGRPRSAEDTLALGTAAWVLAQTNKTFVRRQRPYEADGVRRLIRPPTGSSFPSGHAAVGVAVFASAAERARGPRGRLFLNLVGAYVAASRVYVGVHYPSDVLGGAGLGLILSGLWRGPVAVVGRGGITGAVRTAQAVAPRSLQAAAFVLGLRRPPTQPPTAADLAA